MSGTCTGSDSIHVYSLHYAVPLSLDRTQTHQCDDTWCKWADEGKKRCPEDKCFYPLEPGDPAGPHDRVPKGPICSSSPVVPPRYAGRKLGPPELDYVEHELRELWEANARDDLRCWAGALGEKDLVEMQQRRQDFRWLHQEWTRLVRESRPKAK